MMIPETTADAAAVAFTVWLAVYVTTSAAVIARAHRSHPPGEWRLNHHGARIIPGHLTYYGEGAVRLQPILWFPLFWTVEVTDADTSHSGMDTLTATPAWNALRAAFAWMEPDDDTGLICGFCGRGGFTSQGELEDHIDGHPWTERRPGGESRGE